jgi:hypothetical protein
MRTPPLAAGTPHDDGHGKDQQLSDSPVVGAPQDPTRLWLWMSRRARWWRHAEGASLSESASRFGCTEATVEQLLEERRS